MPHGALSSGHYRPRRPRYRGRVEYRGQLRKIAGSGNSNAVTLRQYTLTIQLRNVEASICDDANLRTAQAVSVGIVLAGKMEPILLLAHPASRPFQTITNNATRTSSQESHVPKRPLIRSTQSPSQHAQKYGVLFVAVDTVPRSTAQHACTGTIRTGAEEPQPNLLESRPTTKDSPLGQTSWSGNGPVNGVMPTLRM